MWKEKEKQLSVDLQVIIFFFLTLLCCSDRIIHSGCFFIPFAMPSDNYWKGDNSETPHSLFEAIIPKLHSASLPFVSPFLINKDKMKPLSSIKWGKHWSTLSVFMREWTLLQRWGKWRLKLKLSPVFPHYNSNETAGSKAEKRNNFWQYSHSGFPFLLKLWPA